MAITKRTVTVIVGNKFHKHRLKLISLLQQLMAQGLFKMPLTPHVSYN